MHLLFVPLLLAGALSASARLEARSNLPSVQHLERTHQWRASRSLPDTAANNGTDKGAASKGADSSSGAAASTESVASSKSSLSPGASSSALSASKDKNGTSSVTGTATSTGVSTTGKPTSTGASNSTTATGTATSTSNSTAPSQTLTPAKPISGDGGWADAMNKAKAFVAKLTIDEKVNLTTGVDTIGRCVGNTGTIPRLNFAGFCFEDSPVGVRGTDYASVFPAAINVAATFDKDLMYKRGKAMGAEFRGKGVNVALGPMMNIARAPEAGRNWEGAGADPFLHGVHVSNNIKGIQENGVIATAKHYALNEQEHYRGGGSGTAESSNVDDRTFHEVYMWPFAESVHTGVGSVMCSYNRINQTYACENRHTLNELMKEELDFQGFLLSDWAAVESLYASVMNGADVNMPGFVEYGNPDEPDPSQANNSYWGKQLGDAVRNGTIPESRFNDMVTRLMAAYYKLGQDKNFPPVNFDYATEDTYLNGQLVNEHVNVQDDHYKLIREIGAASTVLLKNEKNTLPLNFDKVRNLGIFGSDAMPNPDGPNGCENGNTDRGCSQGTLALGWGSGIANFPYLVTPYEALTSYIRDHKPTTVVQAVGSDFNYVAQAQVASHADTCMVFANADSGEGYIGVDGNQGDRNNLTLWHGGEATIKNVANNCNNTIVVLHTVSAVLVEEWYNHPNVTAILYAGLPGQESGNAIVDIIRGHVNPSARLPYTIAKQRSDYNADVLYNSPDAIPQINYVEKLNIDYRHFDSANIEPRYEFGFGLSYSTFQYSNLQLRTLKNPKTVPAGQTQPGGKTGLWEEAVSVSFNVKNTGQYDGNEVAQVYLGFPSSTDEPPRVLRGFERQHISKGQSAKFTVTLRVKDVSIWDVKSQSWVVPSGDYTVYVGSSSRKLPLQKTLSF